MKQGKKEITDIDNGKLVTFMSQLISLVVDFNFRQ